MIGSTPEEAEMRTDEVAGTDAADHLPAPASRDRVSTARGVLFGVILGASAWAVGGLLLWWLL
jgi:hypothetical protein